MMSSTYTTLDNTRVPPYNTTLGSRESLISKPTSTPSSTPISTISISLVLFRIYLHAQTISNTRIYQPDDSTDLKVSTLASSTLVGNDIVTHVVRLE